MALHTLPAIEFWQGYGCTEAQSISLLESKWHTLDERGQRLLRIAEFASEQAAGHAVALIAHPLMMPGATMERDCHPGTPILAAYLSPHNLRTAHGPQLLGNVWIPRWVPPATQRWMRKRIGATLVN